MTGACICPQMLEKESGLPVTGAAGGCELLYAGAGKQTRVLWKINVYFNHCTISPAL